MNCAEWEERIAAGEPAEQHLAECARCREFARGLEESLAWLRGAHADEPSAAHYAAVRARVLSELELRRVPVWRRAWVYGLAAAGLAVVAIVGWRMDQRPVLEPPRVAMRVPAAPVVERPVPRVAKVAPPRRAAQQAKGEPLLIKIETDNPDVVLYWIAETGGDE